MITDYDCSSWAEHTQTCLSAGSSSKSSGWSGRESCSFIFMIANAVQYISLVFVLLFPLSNLFWVYPPCPVDAVYWTEVVFRHILRISKNCLNLRDLIIFGGFHFRSPMYSEYILYPQSLSSDKLFFDSIRYRYDMRVFFSIRYDIDTILGPQKRPSF